MSSISIKKQTKRKEPMNKLFFIGDAHITELLWSSRPRIKADSERALTSIQEDIIADPTPNKAVILCGDNFNTKRPTANEVLILSHFIAQLTNAGIRCYGIEGNHDLAYNSWLLNIGVIPLDKKITNVLDWTVYGLNYVVGNAIGAALEEVEQYEADFLILHQPFEHISPFEPNKLTVEDIPSSIKIGAVSAHVHVCDIRKNSSMQTYVSPGAIHARKMDHKGGSYVTYTSEEGFQPHVTRYAREFLNFKIIDEESLKDTNIALGKIAVEEDIDLQPVVRIKYLPKYKEEIEEIFTDMNSNSHIILVPIQDSIKERAISKDTDMLLEDKAKILTKTVKDMGIEVPQDMLDILQELILNKDDTLLLAKLKETTQG